MARFTGKPNGRPTGYLIKLGNEICERLAEGESLREICKDKHLPSRNTVYKWMSADEFIGFRDQYTHARGVQAHKYADDALKYAVGTNPKNAIADRLKFDALRWAAGKLNPKIYGDMKRVEQSGPDGGPIQSERRITIVLEDRKTPLVSNKSKVLSDEIASDDDDDDGDDS